MNKISVIVPIYNVEAYLPQCLDSIIGQTYKNLEIILVDDGSSDRSAIICDEYAKKDGRIKVIHKENGGQSSARNLALDIATGDYIAFVDSDDYLDVSMYQCLMDVILREKIDIAVCDLYGLKKKEVYTYSTCTNKIALIDNRKDFFYHLLEPNPKLRFEVWNKLFKKSVIDDLRFKEGQIYEELDFDRNIFLKTSKIAHIDTPLYYYRINRPGSTNSHFKENRFIYFDEMKYYFNLFEEWRDERLLSRYTESVLDTASSFYVQAMDLNATSYQKNKIVKIFHNLYKNKSKYLIRIPYKYRIFIISPMLYYMISKFLSWYRSL